VCRINISEIHFQDIASTQSQSRQQQNRCSIPQSDGGVPIAGSDDALDIGPLAGSAAAPKGATWQWSALHRPFRSDTFHRQLDSVRTFA
jgi:hypothetical protein